MKKYYIYILYIIYNFLFYYILEKFSTNYESGFNELQSQAKLRPLHFMCEDNS